ncbi:ABC transporter substrate-binding protein [Paenibacillus sp. FSL R7-0331]|uniref:ABC transporter substrate-binding protein n=1 Tax=Paenibacillus sp. FSL R7-0331 TaxID=1536773 RepID=UPI0005AB929E|nr:ABC transporter substrate-binding protein [Paenibacillus sp. FSL R7-0331]
MSKIRFKMSGFLLLALMLVLGACSNASNTADMSNTSNTSAEVKETGNNAAGANTAKIIKDIFGEVEIPAEPQNLLVTNSSYAEYLIEIGIVPQMVLLTAEIEPDYRKPYFEQHGVKMIETVQYQYNYEQLLALSPDLIISQGTGMEQTVYDDLNKVAPTVALDTTGDMEDAIPKFGELFGKTAEATQVLEVFNGKVDQARTEIAQAIGDKTVLVLRVESDRYRYMGAQAANSSSRFFYEKLGLHIPEIFKDSKDWFTPFSLEILPEIKPDYIFLEQRMLQGSDASQSMKDLEANPLWKSMEAVKNGQVFPLKTSDFVQGSGPVGSALLIDYIVEKLVP